MSGLRITAAEYPPNWPAVLRAEQAAGYLGYQDTAELRRDVVRGEAPRPHDKHGRNPVWYRTLCDQWLAARSGADNDNGRQDLADLI